jgi:nicotinate-nucleotide--dimethylbenzimidazole phosphoribosyltransferase
MSRCQTRLDNLTKPLGSLGSFEALARKMAGITGQARLRELQPQIILVNGSRRSSGLLDVFAGHVGAGIEEFNIPVGAVAAPAELRNILHRGIAVGKAAAAAGARAVGLGATGEIDSATAAVIIDWFRSGAVDPVDLLAKTGNVELAALAGLVLGLAAGGAAVVLDGLATSLAALIAVRLAPLSREYLIGSHFPPEPGHAETLRLLDVPAYLFLEMNLGEGVGAALGLSLLQASLHMLNDMKTFGEAQVHVAEDGPGALVQTSEVRD